MAAGGSSRLAAAAREGRAAWRGWSGGRGRGRGGGRGFTALCVLPRAVAIAADTAVFSIVDAVLLRPLPYPRAERLVGLWQTLPGLGLKEVGLSDATYLLYRGHRRALAEVGIYRRGLVNLTGGDVPERVPSAQATATLF